MKIKKAINDIKEWFKKNESSLKNELLTCWDDNRYIINGCDKRVSDKEKCKDYKRRGE